jgi:hypothetical protein
VLTRTQLIDALEGSTGPGHRLRDVAPVRQSQSPFEGQPTQSSPEQICLEVGGIQARARLAWAKGFCAVVFC